jgi:hypothetical protein
MRKEVIHTEPPSINVETCLGTRVLSQRGDVYVPHQAH